MAGAVKFTVEVSGDRELILKLGQLPDRLRQALVRTTAILEAMLELKVKQEHLSGPTGAHTLQHLSGNLMASVHSLPIVDTPTMVQGGVYYDGTVAYSAIHEFGGIINIPEITPVSAKALHFMVGSAGVFAMRTKAHTVTMPERAPMRTAFAEMRDTITEAFQKTVGEALHEQ